MYRNREPMGLVRTTIQRLTSTLRERLAGRVKSVHAEMRRPPWGSTSRPWDWGPDPAPIRRGTEA